MLQSRIKRDFKRAVPDAQPVPGALVHGVRHAYVTELTSPGVSVYTLMKLHTHFLIVPGKEWGAGHRGSPGRRRSSRGRTVHHDARQRWADRVLGCPAKRRNGRPVLVIADSGRHRRCVRWRALAGAPADERAAALVESGLIRSVPMGEPGVLAELLAATLDESAAM